MIATTEETEELPLGTVVDRLARLLPLHCVTVRMDGGLRLSYVRSLVVKMLRDALEKGHTVDRTNEDGPLHEWDGWLVIHGAKGKTFIETTWKHRQN